MQKMLNFYANKFTVSFIVILLSLCEFVSCGKVGDVGGGIFVIILFICISFLLCIFSSAFQYQEAVIVIAILLPLIVLVILISLPKEYEQEREKKEKFVEDKWIIIRTVFFILIILIFFFAFFVYSAMKFTLPIVAKRITTEGFTTNQNIKKRKIEEEMNEINKQQQQQQQIRDSILRK